MKSVRSRAVAELRRARPTSRFLRASLVIMAALVVFAWSSGEIRVDELLSPRRRANVTRFLTEEVVPYPLRQEGFSWRGLARWVSEVWNAGGAQATLATLAISVAAIVLAALFALIVAPAAARTLATREPYMLGPGLPGSGAARGRSWRALSTSTRLFCVGLRAIPEYVWAFFLVAMLPGSAWPAVLALAVHNGGILGRLYGDTLENLEEAPLRSLRMAGAGRRQIYTIAALPLALPRLLLYFFYRFETCVREATVLGMLGMVSLGYAIQDARTKRFYDEMLLLVAFGIVIVLAADLLSHLARGWARRAR